MKFLLSTILLLLAYPLAAQTYHLEQVTTIENNGSYVFLQDGYAMDNTLKNKALQTTDSYQSEQLTGQESYVWQLTKANSSKPLYTLHNCSLTGNSYLAYSSSELSLVTSSKASQWMLTFQSDGTLVILTKDQNRCLAYSSPTNHQYKLYSANIDGTPYDENPGYITLFQLVSDNPADGITNVTTHRDAPQFCYDLQGRKVNAQPNSQLEMGIHIINGRKVLLP